MNDAEREEKLRRIVADIGKMPPASIDFSKSLDALGIDSLSLLVFRESCEREFQAAIPDDIWDGLGTLARVRDHLASSPAAPAAAAPGTPPAAPPDAAAPAPAATVRACRSLSRRRYGNPPLRSPRDASSSRPRVGRRGASRR